ncbi:maleylpyruvate isomerase N-terminal domain-containing protein [Actinomadura keratinilytica]
MTVQTGLLRQALAGAADLQARVPTCPEWTLRDLAVHVGGAIRWMNEIVRTRASAEVPDEAVPQFAGPPVEDGPEALDAWLAEGAESAAEALRRLGRGARCGPGPGSRVPASGPGGSRRSCWSIARMPA